MQINLTQEFIEDLKMCEKIAYYTKEFISYMQPKICQMITIPLDINIDISHYGKNWIMSDICFGTMHIYIQNIKNFMGNYYYHIDSIAYLSFIICHELLHIDQDINVSQYQTNDQYNWYIESAVNHVAINFLNDHCDDIASMLNISPQTYGALISAINESVCTGLYGFTNTRIETQTLIDFYNNFAQTRLPLQAQTEFMNFVRNGRNVFIKVAFIDNISRYTHGKKVDVQSIALIDNIVASCMIKQDWKLLPVNNDIISVMDYTHGAKGYPENDLDENAQWYSSIITNGDDVTLLRFKDFSSLKNKSMGFKVNAY